MSYTLQEGEKLNGGYTVTIGTFSLVNVGAYSINWTNVYDTANTFEDINGDTVEVLLGKRFSISIDTGRLTATDYNSLLTALKVNDISLDCPDYTGTVVCKDRPAELAQANFLGAKYKAKFTLTAKNIIKEAGYL